MNDFEVLSFEDKRQKKKWNEVIEKYFNNEPMLKPVYVNLFCKDNEKCFAFFIESDHFRMIYPIILREIPGTQYKDVTNAYGYGGAMTDGIKDDSLIHHFWEQIDTWYQKNNVVSEFNRFSLFGIENNGYPGTKEYCMNNIVRKLNIPIEEMMMDFEHKVRKNIKKAIKNNLAVTIDQTGETLETFLEIYYATMQRCDAEEDYFFNEHFFKTINTEMQGNYIYFNVWYEEKIVSTELVLLSNENLYSFLGGTLSNYFAYRPNDFLKYSIIKWGIENHYKRFILGGGHGTEDGIFKYKKSFAPHDGCTPFYVGKRIINESIYENLSDSKNKSDFFPLYRSNQT